MDAGFCNNYPQRISIVQISLNDGRNELGQDLAVVLWNIEIPVVQVVLIGWQDAHVSFAPDQLEQLGKLFDRCQGDVASEVTRGGVRIIDEKTCLALIANDPDEFEGGTVYLSRNESKQIGSALRSFRADGRNESSK